MDKERNSAFELLRIISILMVLMLHINKDILFKSADYQMLPINKCFIWMIEELSIVAVNCFVLISGYFSITSTKLKFRRIIDLVFLVSFYGFLIWVILGIRGGVFGKNTCKMHSAVYGG